MNPPVYAIVGGGHAAAAAASAMRGAGFAGRIILISEEAHAPYERPPLSKEILLSPEAGMRPIHPVDYYDTNHVETRLGLRVLRIEPAAKHLVTADGQTLSYDKLLLATGSRPRRYPLLDALGAGVHVLRTLEDGQRLQAELSAGRHLLVVGGGIIGLEVAASAIERGLNVTVLERASALLTRGVPAPLAAILRGLHEQRGVTFALDVDLVAADRDAGGRFHLRAADGRAFAGDAIVYGIGVQLNTELASAAGLAVQDGVLVDEYCRTSDPAIYAAGDIARQFHPFLGTAARQETWANAVQQGSRAAVAMVTGETGIAEVPWYWTDQYGTNFQVAGRIDADTWLTRGEPASGKYTLFGLTDGRVTGAITVNNGRDMKFAKMMITAGSAPDPAAICDPAINLQKFKPIQIVA